MLRANLYFPLSFNSRLLVEIIARESSTVQDFIPLCDPKHDPSPYVIAACVVHIGWTGALCLLETVRALSLLSTCSTRSFVYVPTFDAFRA